MSTFKKAKVVMLSTNNKSNIVLGKRNTLYNTKDIPNVEFNNVLSPNNWIYQYLYFLSDEIKEGDWYFDGTDFIHKKSKHNNTLVDGNKQAKKVIATTDTSLYIHQKETISLPERVFYLPQPSQQFIQKYIEEYNKGNTITDVLVEYELISNEEYFLNTINPDENVPYFDENLKINPKDNTITIKKVKEFWSREEVDRMLDEQASRTTAEMMEKFKDYKSKEEVIKLLFKCKDFLQMYNKESISFDKWVEENLS